MTVKELIEKLKELNHDDATACFLDTECPQANPEVRDIYYYHDENIIVIT